MIRWAIPAAVLAVFAATAAGYGVFRDELYYIACGRHLDWGYVDHPPLVALIAAIFGPSWIALRLVVALAFAGTVLLVGDTAREMGGGPFARVTAQLLAATAPAYLSLFSIFSMNAFDVLVWAGLARLAVALLRGADPRWWLAFGALAGVGLENKLDVGLAGAALVGSLVIARRFEPFRTRWIWLGGALAAAIFAPHVVWQASHGFPTGEFVENAQRYKITDLTPLGFLAAQFWNAGPAGSAAALVGLTWLLFAPAARPYLPVGIAAVLVTVTLALSVSKPYYLTPAYTWLFPAAAVAIEAWTASHFRVPVRAAAVVLILASLALAPLAKPLLSPDRYVRYAAAIGLDPGTDENHRLGRLPQFFADMHGWREMAEAVARAYEALPGDDRAKACVYGQNYGEAAAVDYFGPELGLPPAISGHNSYWTWGPGRCTGEVLLIIGGDRDDHLQEFESVEAGAVHRHADAMPYESDLTIWVARGLELPLADAWSAVRHYN